jgi:hypothetical protein
MREEPLGKAKPFDIPKRVVWEAYQRVKANRGAAGVDDQSIEAFDQDVKNNLFKLWNRLSLSLTSEIRGLFGPARSPTALYVALIPHSPFINASGETLTKF